MLILVLLDEVAQHVEVIGLGRGQIIPVGQLVDDAESRVQLGIGADRPEREPPDQGQVSRVGIAKGGRSCPWISLQTWESEATFLSPTFPAVLVFVTIASPLENRWAPG